MRVAEEERGHVGLALHSEPTPHPSRFASRQFDRLTPREPPPKKRQSACKPGFVWLAACAANVTAIPLGRLSPGASSNQPERPGPERAWSACGAPHRSYSVLLPAGLAVPPALPPARCALAAPFHPYPSKSPEGNLRQRRFAFCGAVPGVAPAGRYPAPFLRGARTFLRSPDKLGSGGRPADWRPALRRTASSGQGSPGRAWPARRADCGPGTPAPPRERR